GANADSAAARRWAARGHVKVVGEIPFDDVPRYLVAADVVAVPQRATTDTLGQVPAKLFDAMALGRPIVSTAVSMIPEILGGCRPCSATQIDNAVRLSSAHDVQPEPTQYPEDTGLTGPAAPPTHRRNPHARRRHRVMRILIIARPYAFHGGVESATAGLMRA